MKIKDHPKIKALEWYLKFLSEDLGNMDELDFGKLVVEAQYYFATPSRGIDAFALSMADDSLKDRKKDTKRVHANVETVNYLPSAYWEDSIHPHRIRWPSTFPPEYPWRKSLEIIQAELRSYLKERMESGPGAFIPVGKADILFGRIGGKHKVLFEIDESSFADMEDVSKLVQTAKLSFMFALDNIPDEGAIRTCRECGKYFLHLSKKPKFFCNYRCTVKFTSRRRREKDPEGYRAAQREIMRKKYRKERGKKLGRPVEKIRFQRKSISKPDKRKED